MRPDETTLGFAKAGKTELDDEPEMLVSLTYRVVNCGDPVQWK